MFQKIANDYTKTEEYNAFTSQAYYDDPEKLLKNYPDDLELVDERVKIFDPSFDAFKSHTLRKRKQLLEE
ncbi:MAG: hypothetical protein AAB525_04465 [Patescibacteria group bacterium]